MNLKLKIASTVLTGAMLLAALGGCGDAGEVTVTQNQTITKTKTVTETVTQTPEPEPETLTITDGFGREVTIEKPLNTVVSGISMVSELMAALGQKEHIVAIDRSTATSTFIFQDLLSLPDITTAEDSHYAVDYEMIIELDPDIFITGVVPQEGFDDIVAALEPEIPCIALSYDTPEQIVDSVNLLGELFDCQEAADDYIDFFQGTVDMIKERVAGVPEEDRPLLYYEWLPYYSFNRDVYMYQNQIDIAGGISITADLPTTFGNIDPEWVIEQDPDVIVSLAMDYAYMGFDAVDCGYDVDDYSSIIAFRDSVMNRSELSEVTAIKDGQVYVLRYDLSSISCIGYAYMAKWLHPDLFEDLDPQALHHEWLTRFMDIDFDLSQHGVFVYPQS